MVTERRCTDTCSCWFKSCRSKWRWGSCSPYCRCSSTASLIVARSLRVLWRGSRLTSTRLNCRSCPRQDSRVCSSSSISTTTFIYRPSRWFSKVKGEGSPYSITERRVLELIPVLGSQPARGVSHKPGGRLPLLSARPAVTPATLKRAATNFAAW